MYSKNKLIKEVIEKVITTVKEAKFDRDNLLTQADSGQDWDLKSTSLASRGVKGEQIKVYDLKTATKYVRDNVIRKRVKTGAELEKKMNTDVDLLRAIQIVLEREIPNVLQNLRDKTVSYETVLMTLEDEVF